MPYITVLLNRKGGVGKSLISVNLAAVYAEILGCGEDDPTVAVVSIDPQATSVEHADAVRKAGRPVPFRVVNAKNNVDQLRKLRRAKADIIIVDTPGFMPLEEGEEDAGPSIDPLGDGTVGDSLRAVLDAADDVIVPLPAAGAAFRSTKTTIERVLIPRQIPYGVVVYWDPRDSEADRDRTQSLVRRQGWDMYNTTIRHYKPHTRGITTGRLCTQYEPNPIALKAKADFQSLALEHQMRRQKRAGGQ